MYSHGALRASDAGAAQLRRLKTIRAASLTDGGPGVLCLVEKAAEALSDGLTETWYPGLDSNQRHQV